MDGWISLHRRIKDNWVWKDKPFSKGQAWIDILLMVNHDDNKVPLGNDLITVERGSRITSIRQLCDKWGWSNTKVTNFLALLKKDGMIDYKSDTKKTLITVVNYNDYQLDKNKKRHENDTKTTRKHTNNNDNNENNKEYTDFVKKMLPLYPGKKVKSVRDKKLPKLLKEYSEEEIIRAIKRYADEAQGKEQKYILNESTFWNGRYEDYLDENYQPIEQQPKRWTIGSDRLL